MLLYEIAHLLGFTGILREELRAGVAELADAPDLGSGGETREGSSPFARTICKKHLNQRRISWRSH